MSISSSFFRLLLLGAALSTTAFARPAQMVTTTGAVYRFVPGTPAWMGASYLDPAGVLWADLTRTVRGHIAFRSHEVAKSYCAGTRLNYGGRIYRGQLPTRRDLERIQRDMGKNGNSDYRGRGGYNTTMPALPHMDAEFQHLASQGEIGLFAVLAYSKWWGIESTCTGPVNYPGIGVAPASCQGTEFDTITGVVTSDNPLENEDNTKVENPFRCVFHTR